LPLVGGRLHSGFYPQNHRVALKEKGSKSAELITVLNENPNIYVNKLLLQLIFLFYFTGNHYGF